MGKRDEHLVLGEGECDFEDVLSRLLPIDNPNFNESLVIESNSFPEAIRSQDYLKGLLSSL
jgi:sugar phosphate isomerase/epimerase